jgi:hypothetical protein
MRAQESSPDPGIFASAGRDPQGRKGGFVIRGPALVALREAETRIAREALIRHGVDEDAMLAATHWLGHAAVRRREAGHAKASRAYADLMRNAVEMMMAVGHSLDVVKARLHDGARLLEELFPVWLDRTRRDLRRQFLALADDFRNWPNPRFPSFDEARVDEFVEWLEQRGLLAAHASVPAIMEYGQRPDRDAQVGVALHVASIAAWVEHVCNEVLGTQGTGKDTLEQKVPDCWCRHPEAATFRSAWGKRSAPKEAAFGARVAHVLAMPAVGRVDWMARDARLAQLTRNEGAHRGLFALSRREAHDATCILLRTAMGVWLVGK